MAPRLAPVLALLLLTAALAGCAAPPPPPAASAPPQEEVKAGLVSTQEASNVSGNQAVDDQSEFAKSLDEKFHTHNYWGGSLEKLLMDAEVASAPLVQESQFGPLGQVFESTFGLLFGTTTEFALPEGSIVPPETERLEISIAWQPSPTITGLELGYATAAADDRFQWYGGVPSDGTAMVLPTNLSVNDIPHTTISKWRFFLQPANDQLPFGIGGLGAVFNGTVHVTIKAFRNDTLFVAPPHPDFWGTETKLNITQNTSQLKGTYVGFPITIDFASDSGADGFSFAEPPNGVIVPPHTGVMHVTLEWVNNGTLPNVQDLHPELAYFTPAGRGIRIPEAATTDTNKAEFLIEVDPRDWDSPYANESDWGFLIYLNSDSPTSQGFGFGSVGSFDGSYTLTAVAEREAV